MSAMRFQGGTWPQSGGVLVGFITEARPARVDLPWRIRARVGWHEIAAAADEQMLGVTSLDGVDAMVICASGPD